MFDDARQTLHERLVRGVLLRVIPPILTARKVRHEAVREPALDTPSAAFARGLGGGLTT
jgi:hypothetical protein